MHVKRHKVCNSFCRPDCMSDVSKDKAASLARFGTDVHARVGALGKIRRWILRACLIHGRGSAWDVSVETLREPQPGNEGQLTRHVVGTAIAQFILTVTFLVGIVLLLRFSLYLGAMRMYQISECWNVSTASLLAAGHPVAGANLFQVLLSWFLPKAFHSVDTFASARLLMVVIFWANWVLMATATGERVLSFRWLIALASVAPLTPLWNWGFEIRGGNLILAGLLLIWGIARFCPASSLSCIFVGAVVIALQCIAANAFIYTVPISLGILVFQPAPDQTHRWKFALAWLGGAIVTLLVLRFAFGEAVLKACLPGTGLSGTVIRSEQYLGLWATAARLSAQVPLLCALVVSALITVTVELWRRGKSALNWDGIFPEVGLFIISFAALFAPQSSFASGLLILTSAAFLLAFRYASALWKLIPARSAIYPTITTLVVFTCLVPFIIAIEKGLDWPNTRQERLMNLAEQLTDPIKEAVYDQGVGMVPTRQMAYAPSARHEDSLENLVNDSAAQVRDVSTAQFPAVVILTDRTDASAKIDQAYIPKHYVSLANDFWVLGKALPLGGGTFEIVHPGRYRISTLQGSDLAGTFPAGVQGMLAPENSGTMIGRLDGVPISNGLVELSAGTHHLATTIDCQPAVVWVGPRLERPHRLGDDVHRSLFCGWLK